MKLARQVLEDIPAQTVVVTQAIQLAAGEVFIKFNFKGEEVGDIFTAAGADIDTLCDTELTTGQYRQAVLGAVTDPNTQPSITSASTGTGA